MAHRSTDKIQRLVEAALEIFAGVGLHGARVDAIARAAGMNKRLLYHYVGDKDALFAAAAETAVDRLAAGQAEGREDGAAWRVLCHASAVGRCPDLAPLVRSLTPQGRSVLGARLAKALLPELAAAIPEPAPVAGPGGPPKPRIKLRPRLHPGHQAAEAGTRRDSKSSK